MRPEIREPLLALRDALPLKLDQVTFTELPSPGAAPSHDVHDERELWRLAVMIALLNLLQALSSGCELDALDADVENLGRVFALGVNCSTPWCWARRGSGTQEWMLVATEGQQPEHFGVLLSIEVPGARAAQGPLYQLVGALLGARELP